MKHSKILNNKIFIDIRLEPTPAKHLLFHLLHFFFPLVVCLFGNKSIPCIYMKTPK